MKKWLKKSVVILVSVLTFGMVPPSHAIWNHQYKPGQKIEQESTESLANLSGTVVANLERKQSDDDDDDSVLRSWMEEAEKQSYRKFGPKIKPAIEDEFRKRILPHIECVIADTMRKTPREDLSKLAISAQPGGGLSERIFHIYHMETKKDIIRFHVRRDHPPMDGYYFNGFPKEVSHPQGM
ncbi:YpjP family protein [Heyndrickxia acidiproducens]|uniref:YpjP family protein n=1 Tax=Heyndrickxia acidiproducens TaxID=1121084 RepID=UPI00037FAAD1|nr:YpjP family protein [Heyndrickxia acidiproducens]